MLINHIQTIIHSNTKIDVYEAVEDIVYDYVTENKIGDYMEISYFLLNDLPATRSNKPE